MVYLNIRHQVADYSKWRIGFDANSPARRAAGATGTEQVYRSTENPNAITINMEWSDAEKAHAFVNSAPLKEAMKNAGVTNAPEVSYLNRV